MSDEIIGYTANSIEFRDTRQPEQIIEEAAHIAKVLKDIVVKTGASIKLGGSEHLRVEAWILLARFFGYSPRITRKQYVEFGPECRGFEAAAELVEVATGRVVAAAESMCLSDEENWSARPKYSTVNGIRRHVGTEPVPLFQLLSMAQTRAISKACSAALRWVVALAGYSGTPAEEMIGNESIARHNSEKPAAPVNDPNPPIQPPRSTGSQAAPEQNIADVVIDAVEARPGTNKQGKAYTLFNITAAGERYSTFSERLGALAGEMAEKGQPVTLRFTMTDKGYRNLVGIDV